MGYWWSWSKSSSHIRSRLLLPQGPVGLLPQGLVDRLPQGLVGLLPQHFTENCRVWQPPAFCIHAQPLGMYVTQVSVCRWPSRWPCFPRLQPAASAIMEHLVILLEQAAQPPCTDRVSKLVHGHTNTLLLRKVKNEVFDWIHFIEFLDGKDREAAAMRWPTATRSEGGHVGPGHWRAY